MKKASFKIIILLVITILTPGAFSSCSIYDNKKSNSLVETFNYESKPVTLKFYFMGNEANDSRKVLDEIERNVADSLNVKLDFKWISNHEYIDTIIKLLASGDSIDAFYVNSGFGSFTKEIIRRGYSPDDLFADITELFPKYAPALYNSFGEEIKQAKYKDKIVMVPHNLSGSTRMCAVVRQDFIEKYNIPEIKNYSDYEIYLKTVKDNEKSITPAVNIYDINGEAFGYAYLNYEIYYKWNDPDIKLIPWERTSEYEQTVEILKRWHGCGYFYTGSEDYGTLLNNGLISAFVAPWDEAYQWSQALGKNQKMKIYPLNMDQTASRTPITSAAMVFSKKSENIDRALAFMEWAESAQENYDTLIYGIKGTHYTLNNNRVSFSSAKSSYYGWDGSDAFFNISFIRDAASSDYSYKELYATMAETNTKYSPTAGFYPDESGISEYIKNRRNFGTVAQAVIDGKMTVDEFIDVQKAQGVDELLVNLQRQLKGFLAGSIK